MTCRNEQSFGGAHFIELSPAEEEDGKTVISRNFQSVTKLVLRSMTHPSFVAGKLFTNFCPKLNSDEYVKDPLRI